MSSLNFMMEDQLEGVLLVDLSQISLATTMVTFSKGEKLTVPEVRHLILSTLKHNVLKFKTENFTQVVICVDNAKFGYWRRQEHDYYKRNRAISREENKIEFDWDGYFEGLSTTLAELKEFMPYWVIDVKHAEADDCIAVLTKYFTSNNKKVRIVSSDGDFVQLHRLPNVDQWSPIQKKFVKPKSDSPEEDLIVKILKGDRKDCVAPIKVRGDFYLSKTDDERALPISSKMIKDCIGKSPEQIRQILHEENLKKANHKKDGDKFILNTLQTAYALPPDKVSTIIETKSKEDIVDLITNIQMVRFKQNQTLIDFEHIRSDIVENILAEYKNFKPAPRGKMYSYFVKSGLVKLLKDISQF